MRSALFALFLSLLSGATCLADGILVNVNFIGTGGTQWNGVPAYPYYLDVQVNGHNGATSVLALCDDHRDDIWAGQQWTAVERQLLQDNVPFFYFSAPELGPLLGGLTATQAYGYAGFIMTGISNNTIGPGVGNAAIWQLFTPNADLGDASHLKEIQDVLDIAYASTPADWSYPNITLYTATVPPPVGQSQPQELMSAAPEAATSTLLGGAFVLIGAFGLMRNRRAARVS